MTLTFRALEASRIIRRAAALHGVAVTSTFAAVVPFASPVCSQWKLDALARRLTERA